MNLTWLCSGVKVAVPVNKQRGKCLADALNEYGDDGDVSLETEYKNHRDPAEVDEENRFDLAHLERGINFLAVANM